jgi:hypothetical protein
VLWRTFNTFTGSTRQRYFAMHILPKTEAYALEFEVITVMI